MTVLLRTNLFAAARLTKAGQLMEATAALQRTLGAGRPVFNGAVLPSTDRPGIDGRVHDDDGIEATSTHPASPALRSCVARPSFGIHSKQSEPGQTSILGGLVGRNSHGGALLPSGLADLSPGTPAHMPDGAQFLAHAFSNQAGSRSYKLYVPSHYHGQPAPLIVMLHGCTQSPDDFAAGTRMNTAAEEQICLVAYPGQTRAANVQKCWNWFSRADQQRDAGEPSLIAGITRDVMRTYAIDPRRVFVAGLSAGGATAAIMGDAYPELYAAIGVHSGLACGAAHDMSTAFAAMQGKCAQARNPARTGPARSKRRIVPTIVFHGDNDTTVNPRNADSVVAQARQDVPLTRRVETGQAVGGLAYSRALYADSRGETLVEQWVIHGAGHAWSGGDPAGSYTLPRGPDATREMVRFFLEHPLPADTSGKR